MEKLSLKERIMNVRPMKVGKNFRSPIALLVLYQITAFILTLMTNTKLTAKDGFIFILMMLVLLLANIIMPRLTKGDPYLFLVASMMASIGVTMIYRLNPKSGASQIQWFLIGFMVFLAVFVILHLGRHVWPKLIVFYLGAILVFFAVTLVFGHGKGATNWVSVNGGRSFQLSELNKVILAFYLASFFENKAFPKGFTKYRRWILMASIYIFIGLFFLQKELGTSIIFFGMYMLFLFVTDESKKLILLNLFLAAVGAVIAYKLFGHIRIRVTTWLDPWSHINDKGYQITQALFAISSGGFFGTGLGLGKPTVIPVVVSDFIFAAICEEMGVFTGMALIMLFLLLVYRGFKIALEQRDLFLKYLAMGISCMFAIQALVIFGGVLKLIPLTGITIPFVSYGGSSMIASCIALGVLQYCSSEYARKGPDYGQNE